MNQLEEGRACPRDGVLGHAFGDLQLHIWEFAMPCVSNLLNCPSANKLVWGVDGIGWGRNRAETRVGRTSIHLPRPIWTWPSKFTGIGQSRPNSSRD